MRGKLLDVFLLGKRNLFTRRKKGTLFLFENGWLGSKKFFPRFVVIERDIGVSWYQNKEQGEFLSSKSTRRVAFWNETVKAILAYVSLLVRYSIAKYVFVGSSAFKQFFRKITGQQTTAFFRLVPLEYSANSWGGRDDWVFFITQFI